MIGDHRLERSLLFVDDRDRMRFLDRLAERVEQFNIRLYLFVLMTNHFHLVFETPEANCGKFMQSLSTAYTVYYNLRHDRHGHLFDGRYKAKLVEGDDYLLSLSRYVHLNPVQIASQRAKPIEERIRSLRAYRWSSYPSYIGRRKPLDFVTYGPLLSEMSGKKKQWPARYREYVETGLAEVDDDFRGAMSVSSRSIGSDAFRGWVDEIHHKLASGRRVLEDVSFRHVSEPLSAEDVLETCAEMLEVDESAFRERRRNSPLRAVAAGMLIRFAGRTQRQVADILGIGTGGAVSTQIRKLPERLASDRRLRRTVEQIEQRLSKLKSGASS